jgi:hypothetical protein
MIQNSAIICGGMRGLKDVADALILKAKQTGNVHRFIQPDNSFGTWWNIIENPDSNDKFRREIVSIATRPEKRLHITKKEIKAYYEKNEPKSNESWYITPIGNPSGTQMKKKQITKACEAILYYNPNAVIILDTVYARTLTESDSKEMFSGIADNKDILNRIIFIESFSKSHGLCNERLGLYFSFNEILFTELHTANITYSAGPGTMKDYQFLTLGNLPEDINKGVSDLHWFWRKERKGLFKFLMSDKYSHLFERDQIHISEDNLEKPCTLYILLKVKEGIKAQYVFENTGVLGVDTPLKSGHYIRFSVGTLKNPVFSKMIND